jgi:HD-GYP domain-containing protein (c-di-GMP phosphodiesterase class II)
MINTTSSDSAVSAGSRLAVLLPGDRCEEHLRLLTDGIPGIVVLDHRSHVDPLSEARERGAELLIVHEDFFYSESRETSTTPARPSGVRTLVLLEGGRPGDPAERFGEADLHLTLPLSPVLLTSLARALVGDPTGAVGIRARAPGGDASSRLYDEARKAVSKVLSAAAKDLTPDLDDSRLIAERIHTSLLLDNYLVNRSLEPHTPYDLASHSTNVAVIAGKLALGMALPSEEVVRAILAGLVHDLGMARLPKSLLSNSGRFTPEQREELRRHPELGAEVLEPLGGSWEWLARTVLQEHERRQGQGYPLGLTGGAIDPLARIIAVADVFEALSHPRTYRSPNTALEALEQIATMGGEWFDPGVVTALVNEISAFPLDSYVQLTTGEIGRVTSTNPENLFRPEVELMWDSAWNRLSPPRRLDLSRQPSITVARLLMANELPLA